jgi:hypothetical protein
MSTIYEAPHYADFSSHLSFYPTSVQIFSSASCSQTYSVYASNFRGPTKFNFCGFIAAFLQSLQVNTVLACFKQTTAGNVFTFPCQQQFAYFLYY